MERDTAVNVQTVKAVYFNSHAHVERDWLTSAVVQTASISTHTLTWSVTDTLIENQPAIIISTHTLTWSVTTATEH